MVALHSLPLSELEPFVRDLGPGDEQIVDRLHQSLSPRSRYQRFHGPTPRLSATDLRFLAGADGGDLVAIVAF